MGNKETREWNSNTFSLLMKEKRYALETYNYLNGTSYDDPEQVEVLHLDGGFSLSVRNDASFIIGNVVNIYEHQSTVNPNMPLRLLIYTANLYKYLTRNKYIHGKALVKLPEPRYVVFYNGQTRQPGRKELRLSDAFEAITGDLSLELKCTVININPEYNEELRESCTGLQGYCTYVEKARKYSADMEIHMAIGKAIDECIEEGILVDFFEENRDMIITADAIDGTYERREIFIREEGRAEGRKEGREEGRKKIIENTLRRNHTPEEVAEFLDIPLKEVLEIQQEMKI